MNRAQLEHVIRACGDICEDSELIIIGSQAILGTFPDAPEELLRSVEADVIPKHHVERIAELDGTIGELSPFHTTFGYYAHGVSEETATLAEKWKSRLVPICNDNTRHVTGWCLAAVDIVLSKLAAGRDKDMDFVAWLLKHGLVSEREVRLILPEMPAHTRETVSNRLSILCQRSRPSR